MKYNILKIKQRDNIWIDINLNDYEIKIMELKKGRPFLHLIYNNDITFKVIYKCNNCAKEIETSWKKFVFQQIQKNKCLCQKCSAGTEQNKIKISEKTKEAMQTSVVKQNCSNAQKQRWQREEELIKRSVISQEIIQRPGMRQYISERTKESMSKLNTKELCNPAKLMNEVEKKQFYSKIGKTISERYNDNTKNKCIATRKNTFKDKNKQEKFIESTRKKLLKQKSTIQLLIDNYFKHTLNIDINEEYPINLYDLNCEYKFMLIDIVILNKKIAIEVLGDFFHQGFIKYYFDNKSEQEVINQYNDDFNLTRFKKDLFKHNFLVNNDWKILYITQYQIFNDNWMKIINDFLKEELY